MMATEKLTIIPPLSVRLSESQALDVQRLAEMHGLERGEYIRHLISKDKEDQRKIWALRNQLFGTVTAESMSTASYEVAND